MPCTRTNADPSLSNRVCIMSLAATESSSVLLHTCETHSAFIKAKITLFVCAPAQSLYVSTSCGHGSGLGGSALCPVAPDDVVPHTEAGRTRFTCACQACSHSSGACEDCLSTPPVRGDGRRGEPGRLSDCTCRIGNAERHMRAMAMQAHIRRQRKALALKKAQRASRRHRQRDRRLECEPTLLSVQCALEQLTRHSRETHNADALREADDQKGEQQETRVHP